MDKMTVDALDLANDGAQHAPAALSRDDVFALRRAFPATPHARPGMRVYGDVALNALLSANGAIGRIAAHHLGLDARPVRAILFDKTPSQNWAVPWHQDRTIAVRARRNVAGFGPWSVKGGVTHVEPPFDIMARMLTLRVHLDECGADNAPLLVAPGSHRQGRVAAAEAAAIAQARGPLSCHATMGDVWIYSTPILHASERARRPTHRRVLQVDYAALTLPGGLEWLGLGADVALS
jgi:hypothetical protein